MDGSFNPARRALLRNMVQLPAAAVVGNMLWAGSEAWATTGAGLPDVDPLVHLLRRTSFGIRPADLTAARSKGFDAYLEDQLTKAAPVTDLTDTLAKANFPIAHLPATAYWRTVWPNPGTSNGGDFEGHWPAIAGQVSANQIYRALFSSRQLFEVMVDFWSSHLNTYDPTFKGVEQQTVIRANALGNFKTMIKASQRDTAMSRYLNNDQNKSPIPNQNYARELLELHTLGEGRGYTQADVLALSAILTGHTWDTDRQSPTFGNYVYKPEWHVGGNKTFLGGTVYGTGAAEIDVALNRIFAMPQCAEFIAFKLCRRFVSDVPEKIADIRAGDFVSRTAAQLRGSGYDIKKTLRFIFRSPEFRASADKKFARPLESALGMLRAYDVSTAEALPDSFNRAIVELLKDSVDQRQMEQNLASLTGVVGHVVQYLRNAGHLPGYWPTPDGFPDKGTFWASATQFITRWNYVAEESERVVYQETVTTLLGNPLGSNPLGDTRASRRVPVNTAMTARALTKLMADQLLHRPIRADHETLIAAFAGNGNADAMLTVDQVKAQASAVATVLLASPYAQLR